MKKARKYTTQLCNATVRYGGLEITMHAFLHSQPPKNERLIIAAQLEALAKLVKETP